MELEDGRPVDDLDAEALVRGHRGAAAPERAAGGRERDPEEQTEGAAPRAHRVRPARPSFAPARTPACAAARRATGTRKGEHET